MDQQHFRGVMAAVLVITLAAGLWLGYHFTHPSKPCPAAWVASGHSC